MREKDFVGGFAKGLKVMEAFGETARKLTITDVANTTGLDRATARRCLLTLADLGYADYDGKFFTLTPRVFRLGHAWLSATPLPVLLQPHLDQLSETVGQSASASVLDDTEIVYIARASQKRIMSINLSPGSRLPAYCSSMGRVLLASLPEKQAGDILSRSDLRANTPRTLTQLDRLMAELERVRTQGYAIIDQELELGLCSIAVSIRNSKDQSVAAINIGVSALNIPAFDLRERFLPDLLRTQSAMRQLLT